MKAIEKMRFLSEKKALSKKPEKLLWTKKF